MISKINKIKNLGLVFSNYAWKADLQPFKQVNLIYGWNGTGKTTLSRLFDAIGGLPIKDLEYEVEDNKGNSHRQGGGFPMKVRVFNQDYILKNIKLIEGRANSISILLGKENKELIEHIEADKLTLNGNPADPGKPGRIALNADLLREKGRKDTSRDKRFTDIAKTIGAAIGGNALRDYRKPQAEKDFKSMSAKSELTDNELKANVQSVKQDILPMIDLLNATTSDGDIAVRSQSISEKASTLLAKTVDSQIISRLASNPDISKWVEQGVSLHQVNASEICEYCLQSVPKERLEQLARHFNEADKQLKEELETLRGEIQAFCNWIKSIAIPDKTRFYGKLRQKVDAASLTFNDALNALAGQLSGVGDELKAKKSKTTETAVLKSRLDGTVLLQCVNEVNQIITTNNATTTDFEKVKNEAATKLKIHYLSTIFDEVKSFEAASADLKTQIESLYSDIRTIEERIAVNMTKISSTHKACEEINKMLTAFLGHQELTFVPHANNDAVTTGDGMEKEVGYSIMRGNNPAVFLSEGEKTAIAFIYFVVHLRDKDFNIKEGIVVIDDPISSLDSNSQYQAFSFLKNAVKDGAQVFIFTHNFDFLKLLINWRRSGGGAGYYMIKNHFPLDVRCAYVDKMDKELSEYESEYHYLFKLLKQLEKEQDGSIAKAYPIPNIARKVWDTFLMFSVPNGLKPYKKVIALKERGFNEQKLDAIYKFTNDHSHITGAGFNPALVPETKKVVTDLFEMMAAIAPNHYKTIDEATNN